jgi:hypothetical protein
MVLDFHFFDIVISFDSRHFLLFAIGYFGILYPLSCWQFVDIRREIICIVHFLNSCEEEIEEISGFLVFVHRFDRGGFVFLFLTFSLLLFVEEDEFDLFVSAIRHSTGEIGLLSIWRM